MAFKLGGLFIDMNANSAKMVSEMRKANKALGGLDKRIKNTGNLLKGLAAAFTIRKIGRMVDDTTAAADALSKFSRSIGISVEQMSSLEFAAQRSGVSLNELEAALVRMTNRTSEAAAGTGQAEKAIKELGLEAKQLEALSPDQQVRVYADALNAIESPAQKARIALDLFGRTAGAKMLQLLENGSDGIAQLQDEASKLGKTLSTEDAQAAEQFQDAMTNLNSAVGGVFRNVVLKMAPALTDLANIMANDLPSAAGKLAKAMSAAIPVAKDVTGKIAQFFGKTLEVTGQVQNSLAGDITGINKVLIDFGQSMQGVGDRLRENAADTSFAAGETKTYKFEVADTAAKFNDLYNPAIRDSIVNSEKNAAALKAEKGALKALAAEEDRRIEQVQALNELNRKFKEEGVRMFEATRTPAEKYGAELAKIADLLDRGAIGQETYNRALRQAGDEYARQMQSLLPDVQEETNKLGEALDRNLTGPLSDLILMNQSVTDSFKGMFSNIANELVSSGISELFKGEGGIGESLMGMFGGSGAGGAGGVGGFISSVFQGFRADGGPVVPNKAAVVGEEGPEIFVPSVAGTIIPNGGAGGTSVNVNNTFHVTAEDGRLSRASQGQMAAKVGETTSRALRRNR